LSRAVLGAISTIYSTPILALTKIGITYREQSADSSDYVRQGAAMQQQILKVIAIPATIILFMAIIWSVTRNDDQKVYSVPPSASVSSTSEADASAIAPNLSSASPTDAARPGDDAARASETTAPATQTDHADSSDASTVGTDGSSSPAPALNSAPLPTPKPAAAPPVKPAKPAKPALIPAPHPAAPAAPKPSVSKPSAPKQPAIFPEMSYNHQAQNAIVNIKASEILGIMDKSYQRLTTFSAILDTRSSDNQTEPVVQAMIAFRRSPDRAAALVSAPHPATYIYDGSKVVLYPSPDASHFTVRQLTWSNLNGSGIAVILGRLFDDPKHDLLSRIVTSGFKTQVELGDFQELVLLSPLECDDEICERVQAVSKTSSITLMIGRKDHLLRRITWANTDDSGKTRYFLAQYSHIKANASLPASLFKFSPPKGVTESSAQ
jgi:outer membrane lipoprotein-sorting protein